MIGSWQQFLQAELCIRQVQIESVHRRQNRFDIKIEVCFGICRKHCWKRRKCLFHMDTFSELLKDGIVW